MSNKKTFQEVVDEAAKTVSDLADDVMTAAQPTVTAVAKGVAEKTEPVLKKAKQAGKAIVSAVVPEIFIQVNSNEYACSDLADRAKADYKAKSKAAILSCKVYVKPEDGCAYYVINDTEGKIEL
jgi:hypothetical protein